MKKFFLVVFIIFDVAVMAGAAFIVYSSVTGKNHGLNKFTTLPGVRLPASGIKATTPLPSANPVAAPGAGLAAPAAPATGPITPPTPYRNLKFTYKNLKAKQVLIRADFTGWKGVPMKRDATGMWSYVAQLTPGEYAYCFTVDDKIIKDPASKQTKRIAQTMVSAITVEKAPAKVAP